MHSGGAECTAAGDSSFWEAGRFPMTLGLPQGELPALFQRPSLLQRIKQRKGYI